MTDILSAISGQFSRSLILGTFLPAVLFVILATFFVLPLFPDGWWLWEQVSAGQTRGVIVLTLVTIVLSGLLYNLNIPITRFYEGYTWQRSRIGKSRTRHYRRRLREAEELRARLWDVAEVLGRSPAAVAPGSPPAGAAAGVSAPEAEAQRLERARSVMDQAGRLIVSGFPVEEGSVLPTRLGNVIRSFEHYPRRQYRMAAITLWPRLVAKIDKDYAAQIDGAKTNVDFALNCSLLSLALALLLLFAGLWHPVALSSPSLLAPWLFKVLVFGAASLAFYHSSIDRASEWGELVKGAFDLYRGELLKQLGFERRPAWLGEERELWEAISLQLIYADRPSGATLPAYASSGCFVRGRPAAIDLRVTRGVTPEPSGLVTVTVRVRNHNRNGLAATNVVATDSLPPGFDYVWMSAKLGRRRRQASPPAASPPGDDVQWGEAQMTGSNPYVFYLGRLEAQEEVFVQYAAAPQQKK